MRRYDTMTRPMKWIISSVLMSIAMSSTMIYIRDTITSSSPDTTTRNNSSPSSSSSINSAKLQMVDNNQSRFNLAQYESLGFFTDIDEAAWKQRKLNTLSSIHHEENEDKAGLDELAQDDARLWYATNWNPDFACFNEVSVGGIADGHKYICDPHRLAEVNDCLIYSVGSNGNFDFEQGMNEIAPNCEIHTFDIDDYSDEMMKDDLVMASFHPWGFKGSYDSRAIDGRQDLNMKLLSAAGKSFLTLQETMLELGHEGRRIDVFKIDCEGCEWTSYRDWLDDAADIRQIAVEVHNIPPNVNSFFSNLHQAGYVTFHKEPNIEYASGNCVEYSFLKLHSDFFDGTSDSSSR